MKMAFWDNIDTRVDNNETKQDKWPDLSWELSIKLWNKVEAWKISQEVWTNLDKLARKEAPEMVSSINWQFDDLLAFARERTAVKA